MTFGITLPVPVMLLGGGWQTHDDSEQKTTAFRQGSLLFLVRCGPDLRWIVHSPPGLTSDESWEEIVGEARQDLEGTVAAEVLF